MLFGIFGNRNGLYELRHEKTCICEKTKVVQISCATAQAIQHHCFCCIRSTISAPLFLLHKKYNLSNIKT